MMDAAIMTIHKTMGLSYMKPKILHVCVKPDG